MKKSLFFTCLFLSYAILSAQNQKKEITYYNENREPIKSQKKAVYYRESYFEKDTLFVTNYYISGKKEMIGQFSDRKANEKTGLFTYFNKEGIKIAEGYYKNNKRDGCWTYLDSFGHVLQKGQYAEDKREGEWRNYFSDGALSQIWICDKGQIVKVKSLNRNGIELGPKDTFEFVDQMPQFPGGQEAMMRFISTNINYPVKARENNIQGRVILGFIINKDGFISNIEGINFLNEELENEAIRVVKLMPNWTPGKQDDTPVVVRFVFPIVFKLN